MTENPSTALYLDQAKTLVRDAEAEGFCLRVMGGVGIRLHCSNYANLYSRLHRLEGREFADIDFVSVNEYAKKLPAFFEKRGYLLKARGAGMIVQGFGRRTYHGIHLSVDVFIDRLVMCHRIDMRDRVQLDNPTLPLADLLLTKLQIVEINMKDIKDIIMLLREHVIGDAGNESIDSHYISKVLSNDWGFYHTCMTNLKKIKDNFLHEIAALDPVDRVDVRTKVEKLIAIIEAQPKSTRWNIRSKVGTRAKWYSDVLDPG